MADFIVVVPSGSPQHELEVGFHVTVVEQLKVLEYNAQLPPQKRNFLAADVSQVVTGHIDDAFVGRKLCIEGL